MAWRYVISSPSLSSEVRLGGVRSSHLTSVALVILISIRAEPGHEFFWELSSEYRSLLKLKDVARQRFRKLSSFVAVAEAGWEVICCQANLIVRSDIKEATLLANRLTRPEGKADGRRISVTMRLTDPQSLFWFQTIGSMLPS